MRSGMRIVALLTHQGKYQARVAAAVIAARAESAPVDTTAWVAVATADTLAMPQVFFTDQAASVGMTEEQAKLGRPGTAMSVVDVESGETVMGQTLRRRLSRPGGWWSTTPWGAARRHAGRSRCRRDSALGDGRGGRGGASGPAVARRAVLPDSPASFVVAAAGPTATVQLSRG